jgi:hypothetical protein
MARFGVLDHNQKDTDSPREWYDEAQALLMVTRQQATRLNRRLIRRCAPGSPYLKAPLDMTPRPAGKLPPREVPNCFFQPPQSWRWREDHRTVTFMPNVPHETLGAI